MQKLNYLLFCFLVVHTEAVTFANAKGPEFERATAAYEEQRYAEAFTLFSKIAAQGNASAQYNLGWLYQQGHGIAADHVKAIEWYELAAKQNHTNAMYNLAYLYHQGNAAVQSHTKALEWYQKAALAGNQSALINLGQLHFFGQGTKKSLSEAYAWYALAAARGDPKGVKNRDIVAGKLSPLELSGAERLYRERKLKYVTPFLPPEGN